MKTVSQYLNKKEQEHRQIVKVCQNNRMTRLKNSFTNIDIHKK